MPEPFTIEELRQFWQLYKGGLNKPALCIQMHITMEYGDLCLHAAQKLFGKKRISDANPDSDPIVGCPAEDVKAPPVMMHDQAIDNKKVIYKNGKLIRPPSLYSNSSPYGIASPGNGSTVNTSLNKFL